MAPRTRSRRTEKLAIGNPAKAGGWVNSIGLPAMPPEILCNIVSCFTCIPIPPQGSNIHDSIPQEFLERSTSLHSLTQTCQRLRKILLPLQWQKIEVGVKDLRHGGKTYNRMLAFELIKQLEVVTVRNPSLALHVREVSVCLTDYSAKTVFPELVRSLHQFSNMHTLQFIFPGLRYTSELNGALDGQTFPSVKLLILKSTFSVPTLFKSFPNTQRFYTPYDTGPWHWKSALEHWGDVVEMRGLAVPDKETLGLVATKLPHLTYLEIDANLLIKEPRLTDLIRLLEPLKHLRAVAFTKCPYYWRQEHQYPMIKHNVTLVLEYSRKLPSLNNLKITLVFMKGSFGWPGFANYEEVIGGCNI